MKTFTEIYAGHEEMPYIAPKYEEELRDKPIAKRQMVRTAEGLLPGHIILLWRIQFGSFTNESSFHKYFYTTYGIDAEKELSFLIEEGYVEVETAFESLRFLTAPRLKNILKEKEVKGLSKMKREDLDAKIAELFTENDLTQLFSQRAYRLTEKGRQALDKHPEIVAKHPQKKF
ncbi:hypothetical protein [Streptococcus loxodontisalivarius]|uniref:Uncharacterized protein n=1 Tax=Streptococcus loxodontisalivarius TaxID=1349415 RepID=A0ABS2PSS5_9STRE|nr:hypothetical protein [Streptococcus loxodontisalivarius]MBM7643098.1 hypothetical protein [Streptococcus loxodontisalivarius]